MIWFLIISIFISTFNIVTSVPIAANMGKLTDYSRNQPYVNLIRQARKWGTPETPWDGNATFDRKTGWPNFDFGVVLAAANVDLGGQYLLSAKGNAQISTAGGSPAYFTNVNYDPSTNTLTAVVNVPEGTTQMILSFRNTTGPGLQDIALIQPGYNMTSKSNVTKLTLAHLSRFSIIRFIDWTGTDYTDEVNWNDTTPVDWPQYAPPKNNPWSTIPYIVNQLDQPTDIWINVPTSATDDYILQLARLLLSDLNPRSNIYVEYSNEVWNFGFPQARINVDIANDSVLNHGDPYHLNYDNVSNAYTWGFRRTAYQIKHISDLFKTIFGDDNVGPWKRVRPILAGQEANSYIIMTGLGYIDALYGPPSNFFHGIAIAPYFDLGPYRTWSNLTTDQVLDGLNMSMQTFLPEHGWSQQQQVAVHGAFAAWYKLAVHGYEGGPDTAAGCGECSLDAKVNATRHSRMGDICVTFLKGWYGFGFQPLNWYDAGAGETSEYGSWNLVEDMRQETLIDTTAMFNKTSPVAQLPRPSPKLKAIDEIRQSSIAFTFGIPIPSSNVNATNFVGHQVPYPNPDLRNLGPNSTFYYPLQIQKSPVQIKITAFVGGSAGILEGGINNEQFVQVQTPKTENTTTFEPAPAMEFSISEPRVPCIVTLRLRNIINGYSIRSFDVV